MRTRRLGILGSIVFLLAPSAWAQAGLAPEFQVNTFTTGSQYHPALAADSLGNFVVVWMSQGQDGSGLGIFGRKFTAAGTPLGSSDFRINTFTTGDQQYPAVASDSSGRFVVVWFSYQDGGGRGIVGRRYDAAGTPGPEFQVNTYTTGFQSSESVAMDAAGNFVVFWQSDAQDGSGYGVFGQRYDAAGARQGSEFQVNTYTTALQGTPTAAMDGAGNFVVVWESRDEDGSFYGVFGRRYDATGIPQGGEFPINSYTTSNQLFPSIARNPAGAFVVVWQSDGQDGSFGGVFGQRYDASGVPQGSEFQVNQWTTNSQYRPVVTMDTDGSFLVAWQSEFQDGNGQGVFARAFDAAGVPQGPEFQMNAYTTGAQTRPALVSQPGGTFVAVWQSSAQDGGSYGVFGRQGVKNDLIFADGFESGDLSMWSSSATGSGDLFPSLLGAMKSSGVGLVGNVNDTASLYVEDDTPANEDRYRARFYLDTNGFDPGEASGAHRTRMFVVFEEAPTRRLAAVVLKRQGGVYSIEGRCRLDSGAQADTGFFTVGDGPHVVEIDWKRSSSAVANDGTFELFVDGVSKAQLTSLSNSISSVDFARLGALNVKPGASGTLYWDEFESRRLRYIGP